MIGCVSVESHSKLYAERKRVHLVMCWFSSQETREYEVSI